MFSAISIAKMVLFGGCQRPAVYEGLPESAMAPHGFKEPELNIGKLLEEQEEAPSGTLLIK